MGRIPDQILRDLARKLSDDVSDAIHRAAALTYGEPQDAFFLALSAAASAGGAVSGFAQRCMPDCSPEQAVDQVWAILRPMMLHANGGGDADLRALLRSAPKSRKDPRP